MQGETGGTLPGFCYACQHGQQLGGGQHGIRHLALPALQRSGQSITWKQH
jgi:hypothetical protein